MKKKRKYQRKVIKEAVKKQPIMNELAKSVRVSDLAVMMKEFQIAEVSFNPLGGIATMKLHVTAFPPQELKIEPIDPRVFGDPLKTPANEDEVKFWSSGGSGSDYVPPMVGEEANG